MFLFYKDTTIIKEKRLKFKGFMHKETHKNVMWVIFRETFYTIWVNIRLTKLLKWCIIDILRHKPMYIEKRGGPLELQNIIKEENVVTMKLIDNAKGGT